MPTIPPRSFAVQRLHVGESIKIINTNGTQVVDTWAFSVPSTLGFPSYTSMIHTRSTLHKLLPSTKEAFLDNRRAPILTIIEDTSPGAHDVLFAACSPERYLQLGATNDHDNCAENLCNAVKELKDNAFDKTLEFLESGWIPDPLNLFMNVIVKVNKLHFSDPVSERGNYIVLRAEQECVVIMSACPIDVSAYNGGPPTSADFEMLQG